MKTMFKRPAALLLALMMALSLAACGSGSNNEAPSGSDNGGERDPL